MSLNFSDPTCKKGNVFGIVSLIDTDGLLADYRLPLNADEHGSGSVVYFFREWYDAIRIRNTEVVHFGSPTPCHLVPFSSVIKIYTRFVVITAHKCILMCNCSQPINLSDIWVNGVNLKRGTLQFKGNDGKIDMDYIALKDAVDVTIKLRLDVSDVSYGRISAYYGNVLDQLDEFIRDRYKAVVFEAKSDSPINVGPFSLRKSVMAVPIDGMLVIEARFFDKSDKAILKTKQGFHAMTQGSSEWRMGLQNGSLLLTLDWSQGKVATPF